MTEEEKIKSGILFCPGDPQLKAMKLRAHKLNQDYNLLYEDETEKREEILNKLVGGRGKNCFFQGPVTFHYGVHTFFGDNCFINFNFTVQDDAEVHIGSNCNFGPNVTIVTPMHPMLANERNTIRCADGQLRRMCWAKPVNIGDNCWFGACVTVCPGVNIGSNCVIGAGSVVTHDIPDNCFAAGVPCKVIRELSDADSMKHLPDVLADNGVEDLFI